MMRLLKIEIILVVILIILMLAGCQIMPSEDVVRSKNDGAFEVALNNNEPFYDEEIIEDKSSGSNKYNNSFFSEDGNISYEIDIDLSEINRAVPVVRVRPEEITSEQAEFIAKILFDGADMFEYSEELNKSELESEILALRQRLGDKEALLEYYNGDEGLVNYAIGQMESQLEQYELDYADAADSLSQEPCLWEFYPESHYLEYGAEDSNYIMATTEVEGWPYRYVVCNRNKSDYRIHSIFAYVDETIISPEDVYDVAVPDDVAIENAKSSVERMLEDMGLSDWIVDYCEVAERNLRSGRTGYQIVVKASPLYEGLPVVRQEQISNLKSDDAYASNYYYENIEIYFSGGRITFFEYQAPLRMVGIENENIQILSSSEVIEVFENYMRMDSISSYQISDLYERSKIEVTIDELQFGLTRIRIKDNETDFYLVPAYTFRGSYILDNYEGGAEPVMKATFAVINAVDGSVINTQLGY